MLWTGREIGSPEGSETERPLAFRSRPPCALDLPNSSQKSAHLHQLPGYLGEYRLRLEFKLMVHKPEQAVWTRGQVNRAILSAYLGGICSYCSREHSAGSLACAADLLQPCSDSFLRDIRKPERGTRL